ncbi:MAG: hypothetical protein ACK53Y_26830, partial [bacterium]
VREEAQKELVEYLKKTMSSTYDLVEEDFIHETASNIQDSDNNSLKKTMNSTYDLVEEDIIHETSLSPANIQDNDNNYDLVEEDFIHETSLLASNIQDDDNIADPSENYLVVNPHIDEAPNMAEQGQISPVTCCKKVCRILP